MWRPAIDACGSCLLPVRSSFVGTEAGDFCQIPSQSQEKLTATDWFLLSHNRFSQVSQKASVRLLISLGFRFLTAKPDWDEPSHFCLGSTWGSHPACGNQSPLPNPVQHDGGWYHPAHRGFVQGCPEGRDSVWLQLPQCWSLLVQTPYTANADLSTGQGRNLPLLQGWVSCWQGRMEAKADQSYCSAPAWVRGEGNLFCGLAQKGVPCPWYPQGGITDGMWARRRHRTALCRGQRPAQKHPWEQSALPTTLFLHQLLIICLRCVNSQISFSQPCSHCFQAEHCHEASSIFMTGCQPTLTVAFFELDTFTFYVGNDAILQKGRKINKCLFKTCLVVSKRTSDTSSYWLFHAPGQESTGFFMT